jgi:hypothetical protein
MERISDEQVATIGGDAHDVNLLSGFEQAEYLVGPAGATAQFRRLADRGRPRGDRHLLHRAGIVA